MADSSMEEQPNGATNGHAPTADAAPAPTLEQCKATVDAFKEKMKLLDERKERLMKGRPSVSGSRTRA